MRRQHRQFGMRQDMTGGAAEDQFAQQPMAIGAHHDEIGAALGRPGEKRRAYVLRRRCRDTLYCKKLPFRGGFGHLIGSASFPVAAGPPLGP